MTVNTEPTSITAGDSLQWSRLLPDFPPSEGWTLSYILLSTKGKLELTAAASSDDGHVVEIAAGDTAGYQPGLYTWRAFVSRAGDRHTVGSGTMVIEPNFAAKANFDGRSAARQALDAANEALASYGNKAYLQTYTINGRSQAFHSPSEFLAYRSRLQAEVAREEASQRLASGLGGRKQLFVRMGG